MAGAANTQRAEEHTAQDELNQQQAFAKKGKGVFDTSVSESGSNVADKQVAQGAGSQLAKYAAMQQSPTGVVSSTPDAPVTQGQTQAVIGQANNAQAQEAGYSNYGLQQYVKNQDANRQLGIIGTEASNEAATMRAKMAQASGAGGPLNLAGSGLGMLGNLAGLYGIYNKMPQLGANANQVPFTTVAANQPFTSFSDTSNSLLNPYASKLPF